MTGAQQFAAFQQDGTSIWTNAAGGGQSSFAIQASSGDLYYVDLSGRFWVLSASGQVEQDPFLTSLASGPIPSTPAFDHNGNAIITIFSPLFPGATPTGNVYRIGIGQNNQLQILNLFNSTDELFEPPVIGLDNSLYFTGVSGQVYAVSSLGKPIWTFATNDVIGGSPAMGADGTLYLEGSSGNIYAIGALTWVSGLTVNPSTVIGGIASVDTVDVGNPAPTGGWSVNLTSNSSYVTVPASVTVPVGATSVSFPIATTQPPAPATYTITASDSGSAQSASLQVYADYVMGLSLSPTSVTGGGTSIGTVSIYQPAPAGGYVVNLSSEYPGSVSVPTSVTVPGGSMTGSFTLTTKQFSNTFTCDIYASDGTSGAQATLTVVGDSISGLTVNPSTIGGAQETRGTITLTSPAPPGGWVVNLSDEYPNAVTLPSTLVVPAGATSAGFNLRVIEQFPNTFICDVYASDGHSAKQVSLTVVGDSLTGMTFNPSSVVGGSSSTGTVTLKSPAPTGGWLVYIYTEYPSAVDVPEVVLVPAGQTTATFPVATTPTSFTYVCGVYADDDFTAVNSSLTILGDSIAGVALNPPSVVGGTASTGTVTLTSAAPPGGWVVKLSTEYPLVDSVPGTVTVPAGQTRATFSITTKTTGATYGCDIYASDATSGKQAKLMITPS